MVTPTSIHTVRRTGAGRFLILLLALASWPTFAAAREGSAEVAPRNTHAKRYGGGWECDRGYLESSRSCVAVGVPSHGHLDYTGNHWTCDSGYREKGEICTKDERREP